MNIRALQTYEVLQCFLNSRTYPPTIRDLVTACGFRSTSMTHRRLSDLRDAGLVMWVPKCSRTLQVCDV